MGINCGLSDRAALVFGLFIILSRSLIANLESMRRAVKLTMDENKMVVLTDDTNAVVTPIRKAASYEPRIATLGIWGNTWLTRGKYGIYVAVHGSYGALTGST